MAYKFVRKENHIQEETLYIVYMIVGSYFHRAVLKNKVLENRLSLYYHEMKERDQEALERRIIEMAEHVIQGHMDILAEMDCEVFVTRKETKVMAKEMSRKISYYEICFDTGFESIRAFVLPNGQVLF